jgi:hypothetical protein
VADRAADTAASMRAADVGDLAIDTDRSNPFDIARRVLLLRWAST